MSTTKLAVYKCGVCGNIVEVLHTGMGELVCCGKPMELQTENTTDAATEKHVPVIEKSEGGAKVKVGSVAHPMQEDHYIEWIEIISGDDVCRTFLQPGAAPEAECCCRGCGQIARAHTAISMAIGRPNNS